MHPDSPDLPEALEDSAVKTHGNLHISRADKEKGEPLVMSVSTKEGISFGLSLRERITASYNFCRYLSVGSMQEIGSVDEMLDTLEDYKRRLNLVRGVLSRVVAADPNVTVEQLSQAIAVADIPESSEPPAHETMTA